MGLFQKQDKLEMLYDAQVRFQQLVTNSKLPADDVQWFSYHVTAMVEEIGEALKVDKRWKTHRNLNHVPEEKKEEIADIIITAFNLAIFSGITKEEVFEIVSNKINNNYGKLSERK